ncbi:phage holin family protein [Streptomyces huasconensis]|uniref:phage holin family protein n=1 Tax=Streptomyces huasconensis TaxID=1854574 RepID=UPI0036F9FBEC
MTGTMHEQTTRDHAQDRESPQHSVGQLVERATAQLSDLVRQEMRLAAREMAAKSKRAGRGGGLLGAAGAVAYIGLMALAATAIAALSLALPVWAAALIVTGVLFAVAGVLAVMGRGQLARAVPPVPQEAIESVRADVEEIKGRAHR